MALNATNLEGTSVSYITLNAQRNDAVKRFIKDLLTSDEFRNLPTSPFRDDTKTRVFCLLCKKEKPKIKEFNSCKNALAHLANTLQGQIKIIHDNATESEIKEAIISVFWHSRNLQLGVVRS